MLLLLWKTFKPAIFGVNGQVDFGASKNRYKHIPVRLSSAILGLRHF